ncbi:putative glycosyltransferase [Flavobacteriaceae bacterium UJ101]|nr:putative glycosyltransferase [Flavobacteriaceae bacterium UJ101]
MKIVYFIDRLSTPGGMERILSLKANYFAKVKKYEVYIITTDKENSTPFFPLNDKIKVFNLDIHLEEIAKQSNFLKKRLKIKELKKEYLEKATNLLNELKVDFAISLFNFDHDIVYKIKDQSKKIVEYHFSREGILIQTETAKFPKLTKFFFENFELKRYHKVFSKYDRAIFSTKRDLKSWNLNNAEYVYNPLTVSEEIETNDNYKQKTVIAVGKTNFIKAFEYLIEAWSYLKDDFPDWKLKIIGRRSKTDYLDPIVEKFDLKEQVKILPPTLKLKEEYLTSSIYALSSRYEGFGLVLTEAAWHGLALVSFDCPCGPSEIIQDGEDGLLANPQDAYDLSLKLRKVMEDDNLRKQMGQKAKENVKRFSQDIIMPKWDTIFKDLQEE